MNARVSGYEQICRVGGVITKKEAINLTNLNKRVLDVLHAHVRLDASVTKLKRSVREN